MSRNVFFCFLFIILHLQASSFELRISPRRAHILVNTGLKIMCQASVPLTACQFKRTFATQIYNLSAGPLTRSTLDYSYYGVGLEHGQCGIDLKEYIKDHTYDLVGCRVKAEDGVWNYAYMSLVVNSNESPIYNIEPRESVVLPGSNFSVLCRAGEELSTCQMKWTNQSWTAISKTTVGDGYKYYGAGIDKGQCGVTFVNVTDRVNGNVFCAGWTKAKPKGYESDTMVVIVAKPPDTPLLTFDKYIYSEDDVMHASCLVNNSRPVSTITWYFDNQLWRSDTVDETTDDTRWRWSYDLQCITQYVTRKLTWQDNGKEVTCRAGHVALPGGEVDVTDTIRVQYAPLEQAPPLARQPVAVGETFIGNIYVQANPRPKFSWQVGTLVIEEGSSADEGRIQATQVIMVDDSTYVANLTIAPVMWNDTDLEGVVLTASNAAGERQYTIPWVVVNSTGRPDYNTDDGDDDDDDDDNSIVDGDSAKHAAEGTKGSNAGAIIGTVIVIISLIGAAMLVAYARINRKWCFVIHPGLAQFQNSICADDEEENDNQNVYLNITQPIGNF